MHRRRIEEALYLNNSRRRRKRVTLIRSVCLPLLPLSQDFPEDRWASLMSVPPWQCRIWCHYKSDHYFVLTLQSNKIRRGHNSQLIFIVTIIFINPFASILLSKHTIYKTNQDCKINTGSQQENPVHNLPEGHQRS